MSRTRLNRSNYHVFQSFSTRWRDNDVYGHMNNVVYYEYVDTAVNTWLLDSGALDVPGGPVVGLVVETACTFFGGLGFPQAVEAGLRHERLGRSSVTYGVGLFAPGAALEAARARFVHIHVGREDHRPVAVPVSLREALAALG
jgi:acyl-CoA thioester hydrolase